MELKRDSKGRFIKGQPSLRKEIKLSKEIKEKIKQTNIKKGIAPKNRFDKLTKDIKKKISKTVKLQYKNGRKLSLSCWKKGQRASPKTEFTSERMKSKNNPNWQGGITPINLQIKQSNNYKSWRKAIFERDNYTCVWCNQRGGKLNVDHIKPYNIIIKNNNIKTLKQAIKCKELWNINNGRTLCLNCHKKTDTYGEKAKYYFDLNLIGKKILITGASCGIGLAIKKCLENEGAKCISWSRSENYNLDCSALPIIPKIDILINNVGGRGTWNNWEAIDNINYKTMAMLTNNFLRNKRKWGRVITISSIYGKEKGPNPAFTASKAAQIAYMKSLAGKYKGITFNTICPGHINVDKPFPYKPKIVGKPKDVANIVTFLCSDLASHINGACITVDGGESHSF